MLLTNTDSKTLYQVFEIHQSANVLVQQEWRK